MSPDAFALFKAPEVARSVVDRLLALHSREPVKLMHVCGTHENAIGRYGLRDLLPPWLTVIAGPGCPVCVCPASDIQMAVDIALDKGVCVTTFGDMFRVPARISLSEAKGRGGDVRIVFSVMDALDLARKNPGLQVVFFAVGFETTAVTTAAAALTDTPDNFSLLVSHRLVPPALAALTREEVAEGGSSAEGKLAGAPEVRGFLLPGHVCTVMGTRDYEIIPEVLRLPAVVAGFEPVDVLLGIHALARMVVDNAPALENRYPRAVRPEGNQKAREILFRVFEPCAAHWRAIGSIPKSGLAIRQEFRHLDARSRFNVEPDLSLEEVKAGCCCGEIMLGRANPSQCGLFGTGCTPDRPYGPCMVSMEGTCRNWLKYCGKA